MSLIIYISPNIYIYNIIFYIYHFVIEDMVNRSFNVKRLVQIFKLSASRVENVMDVQVH